MKLGNFYSSPNSGARGFYSRFSEGEVEGSSLRMADLLAFEPCPIFMGRESWKVFWIAHVNNKTSEG